MEDSTPILRAESYQLERVQRFAKRLVRGLRDVSYDKSADASELTLSWPSKLVKAHPISSSTNSKLDLGNTPKDYCVEGAVHCLSVLRNRWTDFRCLYSCHPQCLL